MSSSKRSETLTIIIDYCRQNGAVSHQQQLLLLLPSLRQAENITRKFWVRINQERRVTMNKLLLEMLESLNR